jgi:hypothetical protein
VVAMEGGDRYEEIAEALYHYSSAPETGRLGSTSSLMGKLGWPAW